ncbi:hypothetical protein HHI36_000733 [Cryptolaemus montrouzieri]|uniref:Uncharacterized protein n=1 Tax=Cryptolaemus montrouzieri TaxID=559131 RepID=A0ABD2P5I6_9CUCU
MHIFQIALNVCAETDVRVQRSKGSLDIEFQQTTNQKRKDCSFGLGKYGDIKAIYETEKLRKAKDALIIGYAEQSQLLKISIPKSAYENLQAGKLLSCYETAFYMILAGQFCSDVT